MNTVVVLMMVSVGCRTGSYAGRGAAIGGMAGAGAGAIAGHQSGHTGVGTAIGAAVGTATGLAVGTEMDRAVAENTAQVERQMGQRLAGTVTTSDVVSMTQAGLGDDVIITQIRTHGLAAPLEVNDLIALKGQGVSDRVLTALQQAPSAVAMNPQTQFGRAPVVIEEHYYGRPAHIHTCPPPVYPYGHYHHHSCRNSGVGVGVSWRN